MAGHLLKAMFPHSLGFGSEETPDAMEKPGATAKHMKEMGEQMADMMRVLAGINTRMSLIEEAVTGQHSKTLNLSESMVVEEELQKREQLEAVALQAAPAAQPAGPRGAAVFAQVPPSPSSTVSLDAFRVSSRSVADP